MTPQIENPLTRAQADRIINVIRADANIAGMLFRSNGRACVIGGLYEAAFHTRHVDPYANGLDPYEMVQEEYGLTFRQRDRLILINDGERLTFHRRRALIALVETWVEVQDDPIH